MAAESLCAKESGRAGGRAGKWVRGPQAASKAVRPTTKPNTRRVCSVLSRTGRFGPYARGHSIVSCTSGDLLRLWRGSCESHVRPPTILRKRCTSGSSQQLAGLAQIMRYDLVTTEIICLDFGTLWIVSIPQRQMFRQLG